MKKLNLLLALLVASVATVFAQADEAGIPSKWKKGIDLSLQATQNYATANWHNGGTNNLSVLGGVHAWFNYAGDEGLAWDNKVELKYGVTTTFTEDLAGRLFHITDDKTYYETKLGYALGKGWNLAWSGDVNFTLFENYKIDTNDLVSAVVSPLTFNTAIGFDYKYSNAEKKLDLSVMIAPYAFKLIYVDDVRGDYAISKHVGIYNEELGITTLKTFDFGSSFKVNYRQQFNDYITLSSVLSFYTDYKGIEVDWEIVGDFKLYKWLTARVSLNPRYDTTIGEGWNEKIQFKEFVSLGLAYRFEK